MTPHPEAEADIDAEAAEPGSPAWWQARYAERDRRRPRQGGLTLDRITAGALELADHEGLDALTMRRLGDHLHVRHTSLYRHVASREELLIATVDHMLGEIRLPQFDGDWRSGMDGGAREFRRVLAAHPAVVPLLTTGQLLGPNALRAREHALAQLLTHGWSPRSAVHVLPRIRERMPRARVVELVGPPAVGHYPQLEDPGAVAAALTEFLAP
nr:TetR/AcrR family transcriptional regulator [Streptomyces sp. NBC_00974]